MTLRRRIAAALAAGVLFAGCSSGGGDGGGDGTANEGGTTEPAPEPEPSETPAEVTVAGAVTFDLVPSVAGSGLVYDETVERPVRAATVEAVEAIGGGEVLATTTTDAAGEYALEVPSNENVFLRVRAEMAAWNVRVVDNTDGDALYVLDGAAFDTGDTDSTRDLHAPSGWTGSSYGNARSAAPFAMLDTVYDAIQVVLGVDDGITFPSLEVHWSPDNVPTQGDTLEEAVDSGEIGSSLYLAAPEAYSGIYVLGAENSDTDEYDRHVIAHEWGHYFEDKFSRADSVGGPHAFGDRLDMRTAFGEGFGNAFSGIVTGNKLYSDAAGDQQGDGFGFNIEGTSGFASSDNPAPGWYSEQSVHEMLWDLYDDEIDGADTTLALGFEPIYDVLAGPQAETEALTSVFSFFVALKAARPEDESAIDSLTSANDIEPVEDAYGTGEDNDASTSNGNVLPVYREDLAVGGGPVSDVCSTNEFESDHTGAENKLGSRQFLRFSVDVSGSHTITVTTTEMPEDEFADPDLGVYRRGQRLGPDGEGTSPPTETCELGTVPEECTETATMSLSTGEHVLEVYEWTNTNESDHEDYPPIGRTCFDVEVTRP